MSEDKKYQMTYMVGPINVTVRLDEIHLIVPAVEKLVKEARENATLNSKEEVKKEAIPEKVEPALTAKCKTHDVDMKERESKKTGNMYFAHYRKVGDKFQTCFGKGWLD